MSVHTNTAAALATEAAHFAVVGGSTHAFTDEDACWRFIHSQRSCFAADPHAFLDARYATRRELAA